MNFKTIIDPSQFSIYLPQFIELVGAERWKRRITNLYRDVESSPYLWKIATDYHWLELCLGYQQASLNRKGAVLTEEWREPDIAALCFASAIVRIHEQLPGSSQKQIVGRLRDCLKAHSGFASLYLEIDVAIKLMDAGYDVSFPDLDGTSNFDVEFARDKICGEIECKSLSVDAGRQIHRRDFYRLIERVRLAQVEVSYSCSRKIVLVNLKGRLDADDSTQEQLSLAISECMYAGDMSSTKYDGFVVKELRYEDYLGDITLTDKESFQAKCQLVFGQNAHISGGFGESGDCLIVVKSDQEDDTSKPWLDAMRKGASQLSRNKPSLLVMQFQDIESKDLLKAHLRRRAAILSAALYNDYKQAHVNGVVISGYRSFTAVENGIGNFGFAILNPEPEHSLPLGVPEPFLKNMESEAYAMAIGAPLPPEDLNYIDLNKGD